MGKHANKNENAATEEPVVKEDSILVVAEETADQTPEPETVETVEETKETTEENVEATEPEAPVAKEEKKKYKTVEVVCEKLYIRPEPNKKADIGVLTKGTKLIVNESDAKFPEGSIYVTIENEPSVTGYVMAEYVK